MLKYKTLVLTYGAVKELQERLSRDPNFLAQEYMDQHTQSEEDDAESEE